MQKKLTSFFRKSAEIGDSTLIDAGYYEKVVVQTAPETQSIGSIGIIKWLWLRLVFWYNNPPLIERLGEPTDPWLRARYSLGYEHGYDGGSQEDAPPGTEAMRDVWLKGYESGLRDGLDSSNCW